MKTIYLQSNETLSFYLNDIYIGLVSNYDNKDTQIVVSKSNLNYYIASVFVEGACSCSYWFTSYKIKTIDN